MCRNVLSTPKAHFRSQLSAELMRLSYLIPADAVNRVDYLRMIATIAAAVPWLNFGRLLAGPWNALPARWG